ncbi:hypothetical protein EYF80_015083 [Liparis tanakae]|uniref:Uncharacterized protein n=1 Tax=Liparis tanakae TaxID=230148 RepID=A0A4Z2IBD4_9TELE|nr:hypothetical protein EYF80_015083 [Liparis tanakae]
MLHPWGTSLANLSGKRTNREGSWVNQNGHRYEDEREFWISNDSLKCLQEKPGEWNRPILSQWWRESIAHHISSVVEHPQILNPGAVRVPWDVESEKTLPCFPLAFSTLPSVPSGIAKQRISSSMRNVSGLRAVEAARSRVIARRAEVRAGTQSHGPKGSPCKPPKQSRIKPAAAGTSV